MAERGDVMRRETEAVSVLEGELSAARMRSMAGCCGAIVLK